MKHTILKHSQTKNFRKDITKLSLFLILFSLTPFLITFIGHFFEISKHKEFYGCVYLLYCITSISIIYFINKDFVYDNRLVQQKMTPIKFFKYFSCMITIMILATMPTMAIDMTLHKFGWTLIPIGNAKDISDSISEFLYVAIMGPICEEIIFRGFVQKNLEKYSPVIAIIVSAITFGIFHGNFSQMFPMMGTGLMLGYVSYKYSLKWSIITHIIYNTFIGEVLALIDKALTNDTTQFTIPVLNMDLFTIVIGFFTISGCVFISRHIFINNIPFCNYNIKIKKILTIFTSIGFIVFLLYNIATACLLIEKI